MRYPRDIIEQPKRWTRPGLTLVELLVVVVILVILVGVVLPLAQPALKGREIREATRQVNTMFASARARAAADGRPAGIAIIPQQSQRTRCYQLAHAKTPPPFTGADDVVTAWVDSNNLLRFEDPAGLTAPLLDKLLRNAKTFQIRFNYRGPLFNVEKQPSGLRIRDYTGLYPPDTYQPGTRFQIYRPPVRSAAVSIDLPVGAYIDLEASGVGTTTTDVSELFSNLHNDLPITIMVDPTGNISEIYTDQLGRLSVNADLFLLIANGKQSGATNLAATAGSLWAIVNQRTGTVRTTDNVGPSTDAATYLAALNEARQFARAGADKGGR